MKKLIPNFIFKIYHYLLALMGAVLCGFPSKKLIVIGVTGTNGKSTVVHLITEILEKSLRDAQGKPVKVASLSSIRFKTGDKEEKNMLKMTMPGRFKLQKFLKQAVEAECKYMVLEVTSEGIKQFRHKFINFDGAVFTNLTKEHIEAHKGFENYRKAKGRLFEAVSKKQKTMNSKKIEKFVVINADDENANYFLDLSGNIKKYFYGIKNSQADITPQKINLKLDNLLGEFNIYNALAAYSTGIALGIEKNKVLQVLKNAKGIPGRLELVIEKPFTVVVDYAHTPDALEKVYQTLISNFPGLAKRSGAGRIQILNQVQGSNDPAYAKASADKQNSKLICVLGSTGGGRDKWKRPEMGKIAASYCKNIILTDEDPYDENPETIINEIESGFSQIQNPNFKYQKIIDRREAVNKALSLAKTGDTVIITGKGCEPWMCVANNKKIAWDDREVTREEFNKLYVK